MLFRLKTNLQTERLFGFNGGEMVRKKTKYATWKC